MSALHDDLRAGTSRWRPRTGVLAAAAVAAVCSAVLGACQPDEPADPGADTSGEAATDAATDGSEAAERAGTRDDTDAPDDSGAEVDERPPPVALPGVGAMSLDAPISDAGPHPTLAWEPVDEVDRYHVSVRDDQDRPVWAWTTEDTSVVFGGFATAPPARTRGPRLHAPMSWQVQARDAEGRVVAQSGLRPIAP